MSKNQWIFFSLVSILIALFIIDLFSGVADLSIYSYFQFFLNTCEVGTHEIIEQRFLSSVTAAISCAFLSLSGLYLQVLFRNSLAGPSVLGISSGSLLGMAIFISIGISAVTASISMKYIGVFFSLVGALCILSILLWVNQKVRKSSTLLIIGMLFSFAASAIIDLFKVHFSAMQLQQFTLWNMASFQNTQWIDIKLLLFGFLLCIPSILYSTSKLNMYDLGDEIAQSMGIPISILKTHVLWITGVLVSLTTALCGPIAFVGIAIPQLVKHWKVHAYYEHVSISVFLIGGIFGIFTDILSKIILQPQIISVNTISSLLGIPMVIWIIIKNKSLD
jgi:iron complex transport system permease protein